MRRRTVVIDTSVFVELLDVPFESDDAETLRTEFERMRSDGVEFILPLATVVEAGRHVSQISDGSLRRAAAERFHRALRATLEGQAPWTFVSLEWDSDFLRGLLEGIEHVPDLVAALGQGALQMGDLLVLHEAARVKAHLDGRVVTVSVWTKDAALDAAARVALS